MRGMALALALLIGAAPAAALDFHALFEARSLACHEEIALFLRVFARQIASGGLYQGRCEICHDRARELARLELVIREGRLVGRYTGRDIAAFLTWHGRLDAAEAALMTEALTAILQGAR